MSPEELQRTLTFLLLTILALYLVLAVKYAETAIQVVH